VSQELEPIEVMDTRFQSPIWSPRASQELEPIEVMDTWCFSFLSRSVSRSQELEPIEVMDTGVRSTNGTGS